MTRAPLVLYANMGAEEHERAPSLAPMLVPLARAWAALFGRAATLVDVGDVHDDGRGPAFAFLDELSGFVPWLSTREAAARAASLGLASAAPSTHATETVHDKAFAVASSRELGLMPQELEPFVVVLEPRDLLAPDFGERLCAYVETLAPFGHRFTLKPRRGTSGRGRVPGTARVLDDADARTACVHGARHLAARGGAILEPWLTRTADFSAHVVVGDDGVVPLGVTELVVSGAGLFVGTALALDDAGLATSGVDGKDDALIGAALAVGARAARHGYRGPLGVDAFTFVGEDGAAVNRPVVEVNARFTGGLVAIGAARRAQVRAGERVFFDAKTATLAPRRAPLATAGAGGEGRGHDD